MAENQMMKLWMPVTKDLGTGDFLGILSDTSIDRDGEFMTRELLEEWSRNKVLPALVNHENKMQSLIGGWRDLRLIQRGDHTALTAKPFFFSKEANPLAEQTRKQVEEALMNGINVGISIGAIPKDYIEKEIEGSMHKGYTKAELVEATWVPIQSNRNASYGHVAKQFDIGVKEELITKGPACPHCGSSQTGQSGYSLTGTTYYCRNCSSHFEIPDKESKSFGIDKENPASKQHYRGFILEIDVNFRGNPNGTIRDRDGHQIHSYAYPNSWSNEDIFNSLERHVDDVLARKGEKSSSPEVVKTPMTTKPRDWDTGKCDECGVEGAKFREDLNAPVCDSCYAKIKRIIEGESREKSCSCEACKKESKFDGTHCVECGKVLTDANTSEIDSTGFVGWCNTCYRRAMKEELKEKDSVVQKFSETDISPADLPDFQHLTSWAKRRYLELRNRMSHEAAIEACMSEASGMHGHKKSIGIKGMEPIPNERTNAGTNQTKPNSSMNKAKVPWVCNSCGNKWTAEEWNPDSASQRRCPKCGSGEIQEDTMRGPVIVTNPNAKKQGGDSKMNKRLSPAEEGEVAAYIELLMGAYKEGQANIETVAHIAHEKFPQVSIEEIKRIIHAMYSPSDFGKKTGDIMQKQETQEVTCPACGSKNIFPYPFAEFLVCVTCGHKWKPEEVKPTEVAQPATETVVTAEAKTVEVEKKKKPVEPLPDPKEEPNPDETIAKRKVVELTAEVDRLNKEINKIAILKDAPTVEGPIGTKALPEATVANMLRIKKGLL